jgi:hypothetical protein
MKDMISMVKLAEEAGLDVFGVGESHQKFFLLLLQLQLFMETLLVLRKK